MKSPKPPLRSTRTPSTYTIGSFGCDRLAAPRMRIRAPSPVSPPDGRTLMPGSRAASISERLVTGAFCSAAALIKIGRAHSELQSPYDLVCRLLLEKKKHIK